MAPYLDESLGAMLPMFNESDPVKPKPTKLTYKPGHSTVQNHDDYEYEDLRPCFPDVHWPALTTVPYQDKGLQGRLDFGYLLDSASDVFDYSPKIGTEVEGVRLVQLTNIQKDDLARLIATRGVVFFRNQGDFDVEAQRELGRYFGTLHKASVSIFHTLQ